jgi:hypothetical protein
MEPTAWAAGSVQSSSHGQDFIPDTVKQTLLFPAIASRLVSRWSFRQIFPKLAFFRSLFSPRGNAGISRKLVQNFPNMFHEVRRFRDS